MMNEEQYDYGVDDLHVGPTKKFISLIAVVALITVIFFIGHIIHRLYFHELHHIPGPKLNAISRIPYIRHLCRGTVADNIRDLHARYGDVVRISPNDISFSSGESAWPEIYGFRIGKMAGHANMQKDPAWYMPPVGAHSIISAGDEDHTRFRKQLSHAFSDRALANQEGVLQRFVDLFINNLKLKSASDGSLPQDLTVWFNWMTFDIIADLLLGKSFGSLEDMHTHPYVDTLLASFEDIKYTYLFRHWPFLKYFKTLEGTQQARRELYSWTRESVKKRLESDTSRQDFFTEILKHEGKKGAELNLNEMSANAMVLLVAGSETTATLLSGATYFLLENPDAMRKLQDEVRGRWSKYEDITLAEVNATPYVFAVLQEALRLYPPVPTGFMRQVGKGGEVIGGHYLPHGTSVGVASYAVGRSESNFRDPGKFAPERWMGDERYANDKRSAHQPFSFGPRNCLGKNLAYSEMRLILAKLIWSFDLELNPKSKDWMARNRVHTLWKKPELAVHLKEVVRK